MVMFVFREEYYHERTEPVQHANASKQQFNDAYQQWEIRGQEIENLAEVSLASNGTGRSAPSSCTSKPPSQNFPILQTITASQYCS